MITVPVIPKNFAHGRAFENFLVCEIMRLNAYSRSDFKPSYLKSKDCAEIDLIIERPARPPVLVEIKSTDECKPPTLRFRGVSSQIFRTLLADYGPKIQIPNVSSIQLRCIGERGFSKFSAGGKSERSKYRRCPRNLVCVTKPCLYD